MRERLSRPEPRGKRGWLGPATRLFSRETITDRGAPLATIRATLARHCWGQRGLGVIVRFYGALIETGYTGGETVAPILNT